MGNIKNELDELVYEQYGDKLDAKDRELDAKNNEIIKLNESNVELIKSNVELCKSNAELCKSNVELIKSNNNFRFLLNKLREFDDLNTPEAQKIISSLMLI